MFKNIGKKIQGVSFTLFILQTLLGIILGLAVGYYAYIVAGFTFRSDVTGILMGLAAGLIVAAVMIFVAWLSQLHLYAYGKMAECSEEECRLLRDLIALQYNGKAPAAPMASAAPAAKAAPAAPAAKAAPAAPVVNAAPAAPVVNAAPAAPVVNAAPAAPVVNAAPAERVCVCGTKLEPNAVFCSECGRPYGVPQPAPSAPAAPAERVCICGAKLSPDAAFCPNCGRPQPAGDEE